MLTNPQVGAFSVIVKLQTSRRFVCSSSVLAAINCFLCPGLPWLLSLRSELILTFAWWPPVPRATLPGPGRPNTCTLSTLSTLRQRNLNTTQYVYIFLRSYVWVILHITYSSKAPNVLVDIALDISTYLYVCVSVSPYLQSSAKPAGCWLVPGFCLELAFGQFWVRTPPAAAAAAGWYISSGKSQGETLNLTSDTEFIA